MSHRVLKIKICYNYSNYRLGFRDDSHFELYITSIYWATMTLATVGYGDIHGVNTSFIIFIQCI